jgi:hypothetical protein
VDFITCGKVAVAGDGNQPSRDVRVQAIELRGDGAALFQVQRALKLADNRERAPLAAMSPRSAAARLSATKRSTPS